jgi:hypothetical protein
MGQLVHAKVQHDEQQVTLQVVFRKPENLPPPPLSRANSKQHYSMANERAPPFSSQFDSDGRPTDAHTSLYSSLSLDEYSRDKTRRKQPKPRPHSASITEPGQVRVTIHIFSLK